MAKRKVTKKAPKPVAPKIADVKIEKPTAEEPIVKVAEPTQNYKPSTEPVSLKPVISKQALFDQRIKEGWILTDQSGVMEAQRKGTLRNCLDFVEADSRNVIYLIRTKEV